MNIKPFQTLAFTASLAVASLTSFAADTNTSGTDKKLIADKMTTCPVSGDKLGEMGKPYVLEYKGQEVKLCCKSCKKDFDKDPAKYIKKIRAADKEPAKKDAKK
jgi:YHS domain-containing protein